MEYAPHIVHYSKLYFTPTDPDTEVETMAVNVSDIVTPDKAEKIRELTEQYFGINLRPATPAEIEIHEESDSIVTTEV
jgi:hypothetical protein